MLIQDILKIYRKKNGYTQEHVAKKLYITTQAVSKWENGQSIPSIDNLLALSDLYGISLDELVQGSPFFKKPYVVGNKNKFKKGVLFFFTWLPVGLYFTGFDYYFKGLNYLPFLLFLLAYLFGIFVVFPVTFNDYWIIENDDISIKNYSGNNFLKVIEFFANTKENKKILYSDISTVEIIYKTKLRVSPLDLRGDTFGLKVSTKDGEHYLKFDASAKVFLPQFVNYLSRKGVTVIDERNIVELLITGKSLYAHFNI